MAFCFQFNNHHIHKTKQQKHLKRRKSYNLVNSYSWVSVNRLPNNPALFSTSLPDMSLRFNRKTSTWSAVNFKKHLTSMSCKLEPAIWSQDTGQRIPCYDSCQLIIAWMSNIKEVHSKPRLHVSVNLLGTLRYSTARL